VSGDLAWLSGTFSDKDASGATVDEGKYLSVYRRTNGNWLLVRDTWNSDKALPPPAPPAAAPM
jgi:ketosteroid isomerase-like protein